MPIPKDYPPDRIFPAFGGLSPILPAAINTAVLNLFQDAMNPNRPAGGQEREEMEARRELALTVIHRYISTDVHEAALKLLRDAWDRRTSFCLYLRNFSLGAVNETVPGDVVKEVLTEMDMKDERFQRLLLKEISPLIPILGVANPSFDFRGANSLPRLTLTDERWADVVAQVVAAAEVVIVFYDAPSKGLGRELDMIRRTSRQTATIIVRTPTAQMGDMSDFPTKVDWHETPEDVELLKTAIKAVEPQQAQKRFSEETPAPKPSPAPAHIKAEADFVIPAGFELAGVAFREGNWSEASDKLTACLCMAFWSGNAQAQAMAYLWLARIQLRQQGIRAAERNLERSLYLLERLRTSHSSSVSQLHEVLEEFLTPLKESNSGSASTDLMERLEELVALPREPAHRGAPAEN